ncbi:ABC transporter ATP-binding protein [Halarchaeum nitratireducens]|uniref:Molybdate/tungstate import ATP-binding protein WtpC n=1 Tax=Halarchaeum nitratireducens TaxID=489913 RepID=A0A830GCB5_9EURY|nr:MULTISPECIES: ABC transporter ATP-binding protein [Halarchaeum]MBP2252449.1 ABC-type Fe3+/spermidine/putrescine transport system ATPase subunit [Halarchaeum solikamskense]GGN21119.1 polyamine-transporting ATPase [Halarchaeum nitratireducens]
MSKTNATTGDARRDAVLDVSELTKIYPDGTLAVDGISFDVQAGDFCVIIGPSGCGKSTTLHSLVGTIEATDGTITLDGADITDAPTYERDIGLVFQDFQLFPHLSVAENAAYGLERIGAEDDEIEERVDDVLEMMNLADLADRQPTELSAGQKQRVALSRSLVLEPTLLLLDEPLGDMDYKLQKQMERELLRIHHELDITFVYVTHDQVQAMRLADQIVVMNDGQIEQSGSVDEVYNSPATAFVSTFVGDSNTFYGTITDIYDDGALVTLDTVFGEFRASTSNLYSSPADLRGEEIPFAVRPQSVTLGDGKPNTLDCTVMDVLHNPGSGSQVILEATGRDGLAKEVQAKTRDSGVDVAGETTVSWDPADTILLEKTSVVDGIDLSEDILGE